MDLYSGLWTYLRQLNVKEARFCQSRDTRCADAEDLLDVMRRRVDDRIEEQTVCDDPVKPLRLVEW